MAEFNPNFGAPPPGVFQSRSPLGTARPFEPDPATQRARGLVPVYSNNGTAGRLWIDPCTGKPAQETFVSASPPKPQPPPPAESPYKFDGVYATAKLGPFSVTSDTHKGLSGKIEMKAPSDWLSARAAVGACVAPKKQSNLPPVGVKASTGMAQFSYDMQGRACLGVGPSTPGVSVEVPNMSVPLRK
jgi:hypothetical protein